MRAGEKSKPEMIGEPFLKNAGRADRPNARASFAKYRCRCGREFTAMCSEVKRGKTGSCGCGWAENCRERFGTHLMTRTREYKAWLGMRSRCCNPRNPSYDNYGGRGIRVCDRWMHSFEAFIEDMGAEPRNCTLDRIDPNGDYSPENCRWATYAVQQNNRRNNNIVELNGIQATCAQWARAGGISRNSIYTRQSRGATDFQSVFGMAPVSNERVSEVMANVQKEVNHES